MGRQRTAFVSHDGRRSKGEAYLESDHLLFRGDFRLKVPFDDIRELTVRGGTLHVGFSEKSADFELGAPEAADWVERIRNPRPLIDKLGVKPTDNVAVIGVEDVNFATSLFARLTIAPHSKATENCTMIFYAADSPGALAKLERLRGRLTPDGVIWVVSLKGKDARVKDVAVIAAAKKAGLVDTKVVAFSPTHTALKLVIPRAHRRRTGPSGARP